MNCSTDSTAPSLTRIDFACVGRQPILLQNLDVYGYELLFREDGDRAASFTDGERATASVVTNSLLDIGLDAVVESKQAFINVSEDMLLNFDFACLPAATVVLEILENVRASPEVLARLEILKSEGFRIALDDFVYSDQLEPLIEFADVVKLELPKIAPHELRRHVEQLRTSGVDLILAEKVESYEEFERCELEGIDLFQGFFFCRPRLVKERRLPTHILSVVRLLLELQSSDATISTLARSIQTNPTITYKVLRYANTVQFGDSCKIESLEHALTMMGLRRLKSIVLMMFISSRGQDKPPELFKMALIRARVCELLARDLDLEEPERYFTVGVLSTLDAIIDRPMPDLLDSLELSDDINAALLKREGSLGKVLLEAIQITENYGTRTTSGILFEAIVWASNVLGLKDR